MARFLYQVKDGAGHISRGEMDVSDEAELRVRLKSQGYTVLRVMAANNRTPQAKKIGFADALMQGGVNGKELQIFTRQFSTLINAGIQVADALKILSDGLKPGVLKTTTLKIKESIEGGRSLADSMGSHPKVFDRFFVNMVKAGESAGILDGILTRLSSYMEKSEKLKSQIKGALWYPAAVTGVAVLVIWGILVFIIPKFQELYANAGKEPPWLTVMVVNLSKFVSEKWYIMFAIVVGIPYTLVQWYKTDDGREVFDRILIELPVIGDLVQKAAVARMSRTLSTLLNAGVSVLDALEIAAKTSGNKVIEESLLKCKDSVASGKPLAQPLLKQKKIPEMVSHMISVGEQSGTLDQLLSKIADFYEEEVEGAVKAVTSLIEPLLMVVLGGVIAILVLAMYLPIFDMANVVNGGN
jgi:type IV pilus assembly protein PilC